MSKDLQRKREEFDAGKVWVVKIGSSLLTRNGRGLATDHISDWVEQIVQLRRAGKYIVLVSSGAVAEGMNRLGLTKRPGSIQLLQAAAAVGQMGLIQAYESHFQKYELHTAQVRLAKAPRAAWRWTHSLKSSRTSSRTPMLTKNQETAQMRE